MALLRPSATARWKAVKVGLLVVFSLGGAIGGWVVTRHSVAFLQFFEGTLIGARLSLSALSFVMALSKIFVMGLHPKPIQLLPTSEDWRSRNNRLQGEMRSGAGMMRRFAGLPAIVLAVRV